jgi:hypothetical protein
MPATTAKGWPYVVAADNVADWPVTSLAIANKADAALPFAVAAGRLAIAAPAGGAGTSVSVTFPVGRFTQPPIVTASPDSNGYGAPTVANVIATGCTLRYWNPTGVAPTTPFMSWIAVQMLTTAGAG